MLLREGIDSGDDGVDVEGSEPALVQHVRKNFSENLKGNFEVLRQTF